MDYTQRGKPRGLEPGRIGTGDPPDLGPESLSVRLNLGGGGRRRRRICIAQDTRNDFSARSVINRNQLNTLKAKI